MRGIQSLIKESKEKSNKSRVLISKYYFNNKVAEPMSEHKAEFLNINKDFRPDLLIILRSLLGT